MPKIIELEGDKEWQATAERKNGNRIAVVRAGEGKFNLYDGNWTATAYTSFIQYPDGRPVLSADEIKAMFASGELKLLKGNIPE
jgi:hypothetical protein